MAKVKFVLLGVLIGASAVLTLLWFGLLDLKGLRETPPPTKVTDGGNEEIKGDIVVSNPKPHDVVYTPLKVTGLAKGKWFFEGSFPVKIVDSEGKVLGLGYVQAQSEWMVEGFVPFEGELVFVEPELESGDLILSVDNPSGLPENEEFFKVPVRFR